MNTHISFLLDRTGSMANIVEKTISGFNTFLKEQKSDGIPTSFLLVQFDSEDPFEIIQDFTSIQDVKELTTSVYQPRGMTPLYDTIYKTVKHTEEAISKLSSNKPDLVICAILTDGLDNASFEYKLSDIKELINLKKAQGWKFVFLGADMDALKEGGSFGFDTGTIMTFNKSDLGVTNAYSSTSNLMTEWKTGNIGASYSASDRKKAMD